MQHQMEHFVVNRFAIACWANWLLENWPAPEEVFRPEDFLLSPHTMLFDPVSFVIASWNRDGHKVNICKVVGEMLKIQNSSDKWVEPHFRSMTEKEGHYQAWKSGTVCNLNVTNAFAKAFNKGSFIVIPAFEFRKANYPNKWLEETIVQI